MANLKNKYSWIFSSALSLIILASIFSSYQYHKYADETWNYYNYKSIAALSHQNNFNSKDRVKQWLIRPHRIFTPNVFSGLDGYYTQDFMENSYDNSLRISTNIQAVKESLKNKNFYAFLSDKSNNIIVPMLDAELVKNQLKYCITDNKCSYDISDEVTMSNYQLQGSTFNIKLKNESIVIENELYFPGWTGKLCSGNDCQNIQAINGFKSLRAWKIPAGEYVFKTYYEPPLWRLSVYIFWFAFFISFIVIFEKQISKLVHLLIIKNKVLE